MKLITRDTDYAIRAVSYIAKNKNKVVSVSELVKELKIPRPFLRKILQALNKKNLLKSYKGASGGFNMAVAPNRISLIGLLEVFQGPFQMNECFFKRKVCPSIKKCALKKKIDRIERYARKQLQSVTVANLLR